MRTAGHACPSTGVAPVLVVVALLFTSASAARAGDNVWSGSGPFATGLGNRTVGALAIDPTNDRVVYAGTGSGTVFSYEHLLPVVTTGAATAATSGGATLNASVNARSASTTVTFEYGLTTAYGTTVSASPSPVAGAADTAVSADVVGLVTDTTYHFRAVGANSAGTAYGDDATFATPMVVCTYVAGPTSISLPANPGLGGFTVTAPAGCIWTAAKSDAWITVTAGASGNGDGAVQFSVAANRSATARSGTITVGSAGVAIDQAAQPLTAGFVGVVNDAAMENPYGPAPLAVTFDAGGSVGPAAIVNYHWVFGDGTIEDTASSSIAHTYLLTGSYFVTLTVTDSLSATASTQRVASAAEVLYTATTAAGLQTALAAAGTVDNDKHVLIRLAGGTYTLGGNANAPFAFSAAGNKDLVVEGGWAPDFSQRALNIPTVLRNDLLTPATGAGGVLRITSGGSVTLDGLTIKDGSATGNGGGLFVQTPGSIVVGNSRFLDNTAGGYGGGLYLETTGGAGWLSDSALRGNSAAGAGGGRLAALSAYVSANEVSGNSASGADGGLRAVVDSAGELIVGNNTIYDNQSAGGGAGLSVALTGSGGASFLDVHNNIVFGNGTAPGLFVAPDCDALRSSVELNVVNNSCDSVAICPDYPLDASNIDADFGGRATGDIRLTPADAALIDRGTEYFAPPEDFEGDALPLDGDAVPGAVPDIGADEYNPANPVGPTAIGLAPANPAIVTLAGSATLTASLDQPAKRDLVLYLTHADTNTDSPGQPLVTLTPAYLKILKGTASAEVSVQALGAARHGTTLITASDPSGGMTPGGASATVAIGAPGRLTLLSPSGVIGTATPTYTWSAQYGVQSYLLWVGTGSTTRFSVWYTAAEAGCGSGAGACSVTPVTALAAGTWYFNVRGMNPAGTGPWTVSKSFACAIASVPTALTLSSPAGLIGTATPTYTWIAQAGVESYQLWVGTGASTALSIWYTAAAAGCGSGSGTCSATPGSALATGSWYFNVRGKNLNGTGPWSSAKNFVYAVAPTALTLLSPAGEAGTSTPTYTWSSKTGVDSYQLWVGTSSTTAFSLWYTASAAGCGAGELTCAVTPASALATGPWFFNVRGRNLAGTGPWAAAKSFSAP